VTKERPGDQNPPGLSLQAFQGHNPSQIRCLTISRIRYLRANSHFQYSAPCTRTDFQYPAPQHFQNAVHTIAAVEIRGILQASPTPYAHQASPANAQCQQGSDPARWLVALRRQASRPLPQLQRHEPLAQRITPKEIRDCPAIALLLMRPRLHTGPDRPPS
jgi:hypothetical protein